MTTEKTNAELRGIDSLIAQHVMPLPRKDEFVEGDVYLCKKNREYRGSVLRYTTSPADAMQVLKRCAIKMDSFPHFTPHNGGWIFTYPKTTRNSDRIEPSN